jgi:hypothetical protein
MSQKTQIITAIITITVINLGVFLYIQKVNTVSEEIQKSDKIIEENANVNVDINSQEDVIPTEVEESHNIDILYNEDGSIDTSNWISYKDEAWGFSIKYPRGLYIKKHTQGEKYPGEECLTCGNGGQLLIVSDFENMGIQDVMNYEGIHIVISSRKNNEKYFEISHVNQNDSKRKLNYEDKCSVISENTLHYSVSCVKNDWIFSLYSETYGKESKKEINKQIAKLIIQTFRFIEN